MRRIVALALPLLVVGLTGPADAAPREERAEPLASTGYILGGAPDRLVARDAENLATLGVAAVAITSDGKSVERPDSGTTHLVGTAHDYGLRAELLLSNYSNDLGGFDPRALKRLLRHPARVRHIADRLAGFVAAAGWDGIQVDLELLERRDGAGLVLLVRELQARMAPDKSVSVAVSASTSRRAYRSRGYRLGVLGRDVDTLALMTYDLHGPTWSGPGPIGARAWQRDAVAAALEKVPAEKLDLGIAGYGYTWPQDRTGRSVTVKAARRLVAEDGATAVWKPGPGEWTARLADGTVLWWSDARSYALRVRMAERRGLHGLALWRLGSADPLPTGG